MRTCKLSVTRTRRGYDFLRCGRCRRRIKVPAGTVLVPPMCRKAKCQQKAPPPKPPGGAGTELKAILATFGVDAGPSCGCGSHAAMMDAYGLGWCRDNIEQIVTWLVDEAKKRGWVFAPRWGARRLVKRAIRNAERKGAK